MKMNLFPFFTDISGKTFLIVGGGTVAREKAESISRFGERIIIIAKETDIQETNNIKIKIKDFEPEDIGEADFVIGATNDRELNEKIAELCREVSKPVNIVDDAELCSFIMPSIVKKGAVVTAVSTNGASPAYAMMLRRQIEELLPDNIGDILDRMEDLRKRALNLIPEQKNRKYFFKEVLSELLEKENDLPDEEIMEILRKYER